MFRVKILSLLVFLCSTMAWAGGGEALRYLPVQDAGRIKPYDTFSREALELIYGRANFKGKEAVEVVTTWMVTPEQWDQIEIFEVRQSGLREALNLTAARRIHYSAQELLSNVHLPVLLQDLRTRRDQGEKLNPFFQAVQRLENQISLYQAIKTGAAVRVVPRTDQDAWLGVNELEGVQLERFRKLTESFVKVLSALVSSPEVAAADELRGAKSNLESAVGDFVKGAREAAPERYASDLAIRAEVHYNHFHPIKWAWIAYLAAALFMTIYVVTQRPVASLLGWLFLGLGFLLHSYGMALRVYLAGRPPVSNMYETVVWVPWGTLIFATILYRMQKQMLLIIAAAVVSILCLILTDLAPTVLDKSIHPLEPVLRDNFWLSTHVTIISISYAAFFLAFAVADWVLVYYVRDEARYSAEIAKGVQSIYRAIQIGIVLLATGIILGGIWADYSWGRFWGWDPKETWALIALLGYVALLHGRLAGWIKNFAMAVGSVVAFSLVIMSWYGVNFWLGAGLHSYGFGAGGFEYVLGFVVLHLLYVTFVMTVRRSRAQS